MPRSYPIILAGGSRYRKRRIPRKYKKAFRYNRRVQRLYPSREYGYQAVPRTAETRAAFGETWRTATEQQRAQRKSARYFGRGGYWSKAWRNVIKPIGSAALHGALGGARSAALGMLSGQGMYTGDGMYTGQGAYSNDLVAGGGDSVAEFSSSPDETGALTITNKEYISDIYGNDLIYTAAGAPTGTVVPFQPRSFSLNPGNELCFPWLSQVASNYEEFEFKQLMFTYKSQVQDINSNNGQCGTIIMATLYNPNLPPFSDKSAMLQYAHSASARTTDDMVHGVECDPSKLSGAPGHYVRVGPVGQDLTNYDHGTFVLGVANTPSVLANGSIGELWVSYTLVLRKPKIVTGRGLTISRFLAVTATPSNNLSTQLLQGGVFGSNRTNETVPGTILCTAQKNSLPVRILARREGGVNVATTPFPEAKVGAPLWSGNHDQPQLSTITTASTAFLGVLLPASYSGALRVCITIEFAADATALSEAVLAIQPPKLFGNVRPLLDVYGGGDEGSQSVSWFSHGMARAYAAPANPLRTHLIFHIKVQPASGNVDNGFWWDQGTGDSQMGSLWAATLPAGVYSLSQAVLDISEYNYGLSQSDTVDDIPFFDPKNAPITI